jgi:hypothetical protein
MRLARIFAPFVRFAHIVRHFIRLAYIYNPYIIALWGGEVTAIREATRTQARAKNKRDRRLSGSARCVGKGGRARCVVARFWWRVAVVGGVGVRCGGVRALWGGF